MVKKNKSLAEYLYDNLQQNHYLRKLVKQLFTQYAYFLFQAKWALDKKEKTEEKVIQPKEDAERTTMTSTYSTSKRKSAVSDEERDVDEYNRPTGSLSYQEKYKDYPAGRSQSD